MGDYCILFIYTKNGYEKGDCHVYMHAKEQMRNLDISYFTSKIKIQLR